MTDMHTHILPNLDDGSDSLQLSLQMLQTLYDEGVRDVVFTPHFYWERRSVERFLEARDRAAETIDFPQIRFHLGAEVEFGELKIDYSALSDLCIRGTRYILLELPFTERWSDRLFDNLVCMTRETRLLPIIAHIERYPSAMKYYRQIEELLSVGCLLQVNADAAYEAKPRSLVDALFRNGQISAIGTDCHNMAARKPQYARAYGKILKTYGQEIADNLQNGMRKILSGERVRVPEIVRIRKGLRGYY